MREVLESALPAVLGALPARPRIVVGGNHSTPWRLLSLLDTVLPEYRLFALNAQAGFPDRDHVLLETSFTGPGMRGHRNLRYFPCRLSLVPNLLREVLPVDAVLIHTSTPVNGTVSLGVEVNILPAAIEITRSRGGLVLAQLNRHMPYTYGDAVLPLEQIDFAIEASEPLPSPAHRPAAGPTLAIGERVTALIPEGATLQLGIGAVPDAVLTALTGRRGLGVWSEMFSDGVLGLEKAGSLDPNRPVVASFAFGSEELHDWVDRNPRIRLLRTEKTNDPSLIAAQQRLVSVNSALEVDLFAQANACWVGGRVYSGFGGQPDFVVGALHSRGGHAIIALPSWHARANVSTVVPRLGGTVTSFQHSYIVSENGTAEIWGHDSVDQAEQIISNVAHPSVRDGLRAAGRELGLRLPESRPGTASRLA